MSSYNQLQTTQITSAIKRANQRIAQIGTTFGKNSSTYKQEAGKFLKGAYKPFVGTSKSGNIKFDIRAINKVIRSQGNSSQVQRMIAEIAGIKFDAEGDIKEIKGAGIPTTTELVKRTEKKLERRGEDPKDYTRKELIQKTEEYAQFSENFQTAYNEYIANFGESEARKDTTIQVLYGDFRDRRLKDDEMKRILARFNEMNVKAKQEALAFEEDNTDNS